MTETADFAAPGEEPSEYDPSIDPSEHRSFDGISPMELGAAFQATGEAPGYALIADTRSMSEAGADELTLTYADLSISTMDFSEFASVADPDAVFRTPLRG